ncbi:MAG: TRCF domain-containing protein, partial [Acidimicrobiales bacterium]
EWLDRYGPLPGAAEALLAIGRLRAECARVGVTEVTAVPARPGAVGNPGRSGEVVARLSPIALPASAEVRLRRLHPRAIFKREADQLIVPLKAGNDLPGALSALLAELLPVASAA